MNRPKKAVIRVKNHVARHKVAYGMTAVAALAIRGSYRNSQAFDRFLASKDINPLEFWCPEALTN